MAYEKVKRAKEVKQAIRDYIEQNYILKNAPANTGQLRFFRGLLVGDLVPSVDKKLRKDKLFFDYLSQNLLESNDEVLSFFDDRKNIDATWNSVEGVKGVQPEELHCVVDGLEPIISPAPPLLLLQKAQRVMIRELREYLRIPDQPEQEDKNIKKVNAYVDLLFSIGIYEIFMHWYEELTCQYQECLLAGTDNGENLQNISVVKGRIEVLKHIFFTLLCRIFCLQHTTCLHAVLRLIATTEYVKIHMQESIPLQKNQTLSEILTDLWMKKQEKHDKDKKHLFTSYTYINHNQKAFADKFSRLCEECGIILNTEENINTMDDYIEILEEHAGKADNMLSDFNKKLLEGALYLSHPLFHAEADIKQLKPDA